MIVFTLLFIIPNVVLGYVFEEFPTVPMLDGRIVGGQSVDIKDYPYQLSLQYYTQHYCGAALISPNYAVTAGHCTNQPLISLRVRAGSSIRGSGGVNVNVSSITKHPKYGSAPADYDIAILKLGSPINSGVGIQPVKLPSLNEVTPSGSLAVVSGWGQLNQTNSQLPSQLQAVKVPVISQSDCEWYYSSAITARMLCAGYTEGGKDACQGDSGGPLVYNGKLIGIVSWGNGCAKPNAPGVYANVAVLRQFISDTTGL